MESVKPKDLQTVSREKDIIFVQSRPKEVDSLCEDNVQEVNEDNDSPANVGQDEELETLTQIDTTNDAYFYTKRGEFTSEIFKVEVKNLPKHIGYNVRLLFQSFTH